MKPINLKIKGLNSFIEAQEINFEKLTEKGLFGIFGPTGSGKSTILDGITLALYGEVARKSSNFMNTNCDSLNVSYQFQMTDNNIKSYRVDREFKRDNKTGLVRSKSAKVVDITGGKEQILEEGIKQVTQKCEEIIGLKLEDFTRTVVLPQGKFSEFLKLEGKERRNMLERIFNLQKYGDELSVKLGSKIKGEKQKSDLLDGQLKNYEDISDEILKNKTFDLAEIKEQCKKCRSDLNNAEKSFNEAKELWNLQIELKEKTEEKNELEKNEDDIIEKKKRAALGISVLKVKPYIDSYENTIKQIDKVNTELSILKNDAETIKTEKEKNYKQLEIYQNKKDNELPILKVKEQRVNDAIEEKLSLDKLLNEASDLKCDIDKLNEKLSYANKDLNKNNNNINSLNKAVSESENQIDMLKFDEEYKRKINEGIILLNKYDNIEEQKRVLNKETVIAVSNISEARKNNEHLSRELKTEEILLKKMEEYINNLNENCPGDQNTLLALQQKLISAKEKWDKYNEYTSSVNIGNDKLIELKKEMTAHENEKLITDESLKHVNAEIKKIEKENLAITLRSTLSEGEACPVCGSSVHHGEKLEAIDTSKLDNLKTDYDLKEEKIKNLNTVIGKFQANIEAVIANIISIEEKLQQLGDEFKSCSVQELENKFEKLKNDINNYNDVKVKSEKDVKAINEKMNNINIDYNKSNAKLNHNNEYLTKLKNDFNAKDEEARKINIELSALKDELSIEDFKEKSDEIFKKEKEKAALEKDIKKKRESLFEEQALNDKLKKAIISINEELKEKNATLNEKSITIEDKKNSIKNKVGSEENLDNLKNSIVNEIRKIEDEYDASVIRNKETEKQYNECNEKIISFQGNLNSLNQRLIKDKEDLDSALREEGIKDIRDAKDNFISKQEIDIMLLQTEEYKAEITKLSGAVEDFIKKINNRSLNEEEWLEIQNVKNEKSETLEMLTENSIKLEQEVKNISEKLIYKKELLNNKEELDHKLSLLDDLEKLFKGKKFVEFVAANQLKYVSIEACKKLKEITGGQYGLDVDENGRFLIRDYKNGGVQRDASTLSGGETFVASLSLALALSAQIQLKGTAPLELFFLDEGFGTLDDNLLEVVMDSLEKIHNSRLSIGIISHVESIKNRVPVKLTVTPAVSGMGGSKVKIERN